MIRAVINKFFRLGLLVAVVPDGAAGQLGHFAAVGQVVKRPGAGGPALVGGRHDDVVLGQDRLHALLVVIWMDSRPRSGPTARRWHVNVPEVLRKVGLVIKAAPSAKIFKICPGRFRRIGLGAVHHRGLEQRPEHARLHFVGDVSAMVCFDEKETFALHPDVGRRREKNDRAGVPGAVAGLVNVAFRRLADQLQFVGRPLRKDFIWNGVTRSSHPPIGPCVAAQENRSACFAGRGVSR
jgi:hypothetical protein